MFKIWYGDGSTYASKDGPPELAPKLNVQIIALSDPDYGRILLRSNDFYIWSTYDGREDWQGVDLAGYYDYMFSPGKKIVLFGRTIGMNDWNRLMSIAINDPDLPAKTVWHESEVKP